MQALIAIEPLGTLVKLVATLLPFLFVIAAFGFVYVLMPNTRVRVVSALVGATVAGILWQTLGWGFAAFIVGSTKYTAIYAGFAIVIFSMIWLYLNWLIVLIGASIACYHQYPALLATPRREFQLSNRVKEKIALLIATFIGRNYYTNTPAWSLEALADRLGVPVMSVEICTHGHSARRIHHRNRRRSAALSSGALVRDDHREGSARCHAHRRGGASLSAGILPHEAEVERVLARVDDAVDASLHGSSLRELAMASVSPIAGMEG